VAHRLFKHWKQFRRAPNARDLLSALIDRADIERQYPLGGGVLRIECSQEMLDELAIFDSDELEDDEIEKT
jgi:hypothetical protein